MVDIKAYRRGSMLLEVIVSASLIGSLLVILNQTIVQLNRQTRLADRQFIAQQTLENLLEEFTSRPWGEINVEGVATLRVPEIASTRLPRVVLAGEVIDEELPTPAKQVTLHLHWQDTPGGRQQPLSLTTWIYKRPEARR